jgi:hypothetical protein
MPGRLALLSAVSMLALPVLAARAADRDFDLVNSTSFRIDMVKVRPVGTQQWGEDLLGANVTVEPNDRAEIVIGDGRACLHDIQLTVRQSAAADGLISAEWNRINLCRLATMTLSHNGQAYQAAWQNKAPATPQAAPAQSR